MTQIKAAVIQQILNERFPTIVVRRDADVDAGDNAFDVFGIPDGKLAKFIEYRIEALPDILTRQKLPGVSLIPHTMSDTRTFYPEIECGHETGARGAAQTSIKKQLKRQNGRPKAMRNR